MAKKKKGGGARIASRAEREARKQKAPEPFGPKKYLKENWFRMILTAAILAVLAVVANMLWPGDYVMPCVVAYLIGQLYLYYRAYREEKKKTADK